MGIPDTLTSRKNQLTDTHPWILLLEVQANATTVFRFANNTTDIEWGGKTWIAFPMQVGEFNEDSKGELPSFSIQVCNTDLILVPYLETYNGFTDCDVILRLIYSGDLNQPEAFKEIWQIKKTTYDNYWVKFQLGVDNPFVKRRPERIYSPNTCPYKFGDIECGYKVKDNELACQQTFSTCKIPERFGADLGIGSSGLWVK